MSKSTCWGKHNLELRKQEYLKQIRAFIKDQLDDNNKSEIARVLGCSTTTSRKIQAGDLTNVSLDMLYTIAMNLEMGPSVTIPEYGSYMG